MNRSMFRKYWEGGGEVSVIPFRGYIVGLLMIWIGFFLWPFFIIAGWYLHIVYHGQMNDPFNNTGKNFRTIKKGEKK